MVGNKITFGKALVFMIIKSMILRNKWFLSLMFGKGNFSEINVAEFCLFVLLL